MAVLIDKSAWSKSSQNSSGGHYDERATEYENMAYRCRKCSISCVFTADAQKAAYEVQKKFVWWLPSLCAKCFEELDALRTEDRYFQKQWDEAPEEIRRNREFINRWLAVLNAISEYGKRSNSSMAVMLARLLKKSQGE